MLAADQLGVDGDAVEFARQIGGKAAPAPSASSITPADTPESSLFIGILPKARAYLGRPHLEAPTNERFIHIQTEHS